MKKDLKHLTPRSFLPVAIAGVFAVALVIGLVVMLMQPEPAGPTPDELAAATAKGRQFETGDQVTVDYAQAMTWYRKAADAGYGPAEYAVGAMLAAGRGGPKDEKAALEWFRRSAEHGSPEGQARLAAALLAGAGGHDDLVEALKWLLLGAEAVADPAAKQDALARRAQLLSQLDAAAIDDAKARAEAWHKARPAPQ